MTAEGRERATIGRFEQDSRTCDLDAALGLLAKDIRWNDLQGFPYGGKLTGPEQVKAQVFGRIFDDWATFGADVDRTIVSADGRSVVALGRYTGTHKASGKKLDTPFAHAWETARGALTRFETFTDTATLRDAMV